MNLVPEGVLNRAQILKEQRKGLFIYQCTECRDDQKKREYFLFKTGHEGLSILTIELCPEDLDKNISLAMHYNGYFGENWLFYFSIIITGDSSKNLVSAAQSSIFNNGKLIKNS